MFKDRKEAGQLLADELLQYKKQKDTLVLAIPRGGVPVAHELAQRLDLPLDVAEGMREGMRDGMRDVHK